MSEEINDPKPDDPKPDDPKPDDPKPDDPKPDDPKHDDPRMKLVRYAVPFKVRKMLEANRVRYEAEIARKLAELEKQQEDLIRGFDNPRYTGHRFTGQSESSTSTSKEVDAQIEASKKRIQELEALIAIADESDKEQSAQVETLQATLDSRDAELEELRRHQDLRHLLDRVSPTAHKALKEGGELRKKFESEELLLAYVMSIDIRRSTELMLKAKTPDEFAKFVSTVCQQLRDSILSHSGVFDKFTGDGILAFFPIFFTGEDAGYAALSAARNCHEQFKRHYHSHRHCFNSVLLDIGLGIGIDYGYVKFVQIGGELTVVGTPVVYACRLGGAPATHTYLNQPARDEIFEKYSAHCTISEAAIEFKHEGKMLAYDVSLNEKPYKMPRPDWAPDLDLTNMMEQWAESLIKAVSVLRGPDDDTPKSDGSSDNPTQTTR